jgi:hypothetical protein
MFVNGARTHSRRGKAREHGSGLLRLLVFSSFCSGIPAAEKKRIPIYEIFLRVWWAFYMRIMGT